MTLLAALHSITGTFHSFAAAWGEKVAPYALAGHALAGRRIFGGDFRPVAFQFFGDELGEAGEGSLTHFRARDANDDGIVGPDHHPGVDLGRAVGGAHHGRATEGNIEAEG